MKLKIKTKAYIVLCSVVSCLLSPSFVFAEGEETIKPDGNELANLIKGYTDPLTTAAMILIPSVCLLYCLVEGVKWYIKGEAYQQQNPLVDKLKKAIVIAVVMFSITAILKIFGIK